MIFIFLSSGLFLGWSLGGNDAANVFGTAVGSKMVRFKTAAIIASVFVVIGAVIGGSGAAHTLGKLGAVNAIAGSFMVAFSAGFTVFWMTRLKLPVSTSQAIVGAIIGWNLFSGSLTDYDSLTKIVLTWVLCPVLSALIAASIFVIFRSVLNRIKIHILRVDMRTRIGLILVGAFGSYSLGANNIANVMGVFVPAEPFSEINFFNLFTLSGTQVLFLLGGLAIAAGIITYSHKVMDTVGGSLMKISPVVALVVVLSQAIVLFLFSSEALEHWLVSNNLPAIPLVPVSSSQAVIGAVLGIGLIKGGKGIRFRVLGEIATGWVTTPVIAGIISFVALFFLQNIFNQQVYEPQTYKLTPQVVDYLSEEKNIKDQGLSDIINKEYYNGVKFNSDLMNNTNLDSDNRSEVIHASRHEVYFMDEYIINNKIKANWLSPGQLNALKQISGHTYNYSWQVIGALGKLTDEWMLKDDNIINKAYNKDIRKRHKHILRQFRITDEEK